jgi:hypothetical protein
MYIEWPGPLETLPELTLWPSEVSPIEAYISKIRAWPGFDCLACRTPVRVQWLEGDEPKEWNLSLSCQCHTSVFRGDQAPWDDALPQNSEEWDETRLGIDS